MLGIPGTSATDVWVMNNLYADHYDGSIWTTYANPNSCYGTAVLALRPAPCSPDSTGAWPSGRARVTPGRRRTRSRWTSSSRSRTCGGAGPPTSGRWAAIDGVYGSLTHFDGTSWTRTHLGKREFTVVWGSGPSDVWAATGQSALAHYDGTAWTFSAPTFPSHVRFPGSLVGPGGQRHLDDGPLRHRCTTTEAPGP